MTRKTAIGIARAGLVFAFAANAFGQEKHIKKSDLPAAVQKVADEQSKGATVRGYTKETEDGKVEYEVEMTLHGRSKDVSIDAAGNILEVEDQVEVNQLPPAIRDAIQKKAGSGTIRKVESITNQGKLVAYEAHILTGSKRSEIQVGPAGQVLDHEE